MSEDIQSIGDAQLEILNVLWDKGECTLGDVWSVMNKSRPLSKNTIQTLLTRMVDKGLVSYRAEGRSFIYKACQGRESTLQGLLKRFVDTVFGGSSEGLVMTLLSEKERSDPAEAERLRTMLQDKEDRK